MIPIEILCGRLSNKMFIMAAHFAYCRDNGVPFFVQDEKYFLKYEKEIREMYGTGIGFIDRISIHVRRGKNPMNPGEPAYSDNKFYVDLGHHLHHENIDNYYIRAMALFPNEKFLIFSDDMEWCKKQDIFKDCEFSEGNSEVEDLNLMASCKSNIIANSSFSWWAAWLNPNPDKVVVAPQKWFSNPEDEKLIGIPQKWIRI